MKYCEQCKVHYNTDLEHCVFCNQALINKSTEEPTFKFAVLNKKSRSNFFFRLFIFLNLVSALLSIYIDYSSGQPLSWSWIVAVTNAYIITMFVLMWPASLWTSRVSKIMIMTGLTVILLGLAINDASWAIDYVFPFSIIANMTMLSLLILFNRKKWFDYFGNLFIISLLGLIPGLLNLIHVTQISWPSTASFIYSIITILGIIFLPSKSSREEFKRRFHI